MALIVALVVAGACAPVAARVARSLGIVDRPGPLKVHDRPVPYLGGVAVFVGSAIPMAMHRPAFLLPLGLALALGLADDAYDLSAVLRLACEVAIGLAAAGVVATRGPIGFVATAAGVVVLLNAVNLLDGLDGLASSVAAVSALAFAAVLDGGARSAALALAGGALGVLLWNRPPARIYLGDAGSYLLGTGLALLLATSYGRGQPLALAAGSALFVAVPVADTTVAILRRHRAGRPLLAGDRGHIYDQLVDRGRSATAAAGLCLGAQVAAALVGIGLTALPAPVAVAGAAVVVALVGGATVRAFTAPSSWSA